MLKSNNKFLFLFRGLPGSGKTTAASVLSNNMELSADQYFEDADGNYNFDIEKLYAAHKWCENSVKEIMVAEKNNKEHFILTMPSGDIKIFLRRNKNISVANTFTTEKEMKPYFELAEKYGYNVVTMIVENRHGSESIHGVPAETMEKMRNRFNVKL